MTNTRQATLGAIVQDDGVLFRVWAPDAERLELVLEPSGESREMRRDDDGVFTLRADDLGPGTRYRYRMRDQAFPDPASRYQPEGVHGPSEVVDPAYPWRARDWQGIPREDLVFYELHVGTFTPEGTFAGVERQLPYLRDLGVTALELLPVSAFPGERGWGYDPAAQFAPHHAYGRPEDLRRLVDSAHGHGLAVYLDIVYNHFGPDGAYAVAFAPPFFTSRHTTPWGQAINLDDAGSEHVRRFFLENARHWLEEYRFDGFRVDAAFALVDDSPKHFLTELAETVHAVPGWRRQLFAEDHRNERRVVLPPGEDGHGFDGVWADDFHHQIRSRLAGDEHGYYRDHSGSSEDIARTIRQGWLFTGQFSRHEGHERGTSTDGIPKEAFVLTIQNHDQIGNRPRGNRLTDDADMASFRAASALLLFLPQLPLLFMGQEWAATTPWQYFTDHSEELGRLVSQGRREEFRDFPEFAGDVPDPQDPETFRRSRLNWLELNEDRHDRTRALYADLLALRRTLDRADVTASVPHDGGLEVTRGRHTLLLAFSGGVELPVPAGARTVLVTEDARYAADGVPPQVVDGVATFAGPAALVVERVS